MVIDTTPKGADVSSDDDEDNAPAAAAKPVEELNAEEAPPAPPKRGRGRPKKEKAVREPQTPAELAEAVAEQ